MEGITKKIYHRPYGGVKALPAKPAEPMTFAELRMLRDVQIEEEFRALKMQAQLLRTLVPSVS